ncbi:NAD(P)/FAD-dependent oxidoreductase [Thalassotalea psychrophila]|uniref:NAD(P)/FAD-dependent oxidoreductase n=1 Tax=Thalassotalea psychrophila TaxID=3065647 RepID=A0ABY9TY73_9GAMM|nr:NAD(P)/FAD-dependent oxidoreductase [Colwelliaceae bacterium SQ149]
MYDYIVVGGSQAGLAMGYQLKKLDVSFLIVDSGNEIGSAWLNRWDSLTLFTPKQYNGLPGLPYQGPNEYPTKVDVAAYLTNYVSKFKLPIQLKTTVQALHKNNQTYTLDTSMGELHCKNVVVATGPFHTPFIPDCAANIDAGITQLHSSAYKGPKQLQQGDTLVVGGGDSAVQILAEISETDRTCYSSGINSLASLPQSFLGKTLWWWLKNIGVLSLSKYSYLGKQIAKRMQPVIGTNVKKLLKKSNIKQVGRTVAATSNSITFSDTEVHSIKNIVWATGYKPDFSWLGNVKLDEQGYPENYRGVSAVQGLYFIGLPWMHTRGSATLGGVGKDSEYLHQYITNLTATPDNVPAGNFA